MTFDKRFQRSLSDIYNWTQNPPNVDLPNTDTDARNAVVALQSQLQAMHGVLKVATSMIERGLSPEMRRLFRADIDAAQEIRLPVIVTERDEEEGEEMPDPYVVQPPVPAPAKKSKDDDDVDEDDWDLDEPPTTKGKKLIATDSDAAIPEKVATKTAVKGKPSTKDVKPNDKPLKTKFGPLKTLNEWLTKLHESTGIEFNPKQVLYRHQRFEHPKIILLPSTFADYRKLSDWMYNSLDAETYALSSGKEQATNQHWATIPVAALAEASVSLRLPKGAETELAKAD